VLDWFTDGHLLPYTGQDKVHAAWSTQRRLPMPGQTHLVTCDDQGRVVYLKTNFPVKTPPVREEPGWGGVFSAPSQPLSER
jgi:hypothetical protein